MNDRVTSDPAAFLDAMQRQSVRHETPCGVGRMVWHMWDESGGTAPVVVLFHGGAGSWRHWVKTIPALLPSYRVLVPDLPGLGESDYPPDDKDVEGIAAIVIDGIATIVGPTTTYDVVGFSFGGMMAATVGALRGDVVRSVTIIGSAGVADQGNLASMVRMEKVRHLEGDERRETHRINLGRLMIADPAKIDDLALTIQDWNTVRSRLKTPPLSRGGAMLRAIDRLRVPMNGMWGERDAPADPKGPGRAASLKARRPEADIRIVPGAGHWAAFEAPGFVNPTLLEMLARTRPAGV
jgi:pimeloyl-ACP methyl ester carboxylesterase